MRASLQCFLIFCMSCTQSYLIQIDTDPAFFLYGTNLDFIVFTACCKRGYYISRLNHSYKCKWLVLVPTAVTSTVSLQKYLAMPVPLMSSTVTFWFVWVKGDVCWPAAHLTRLTGTPGHWVQCRGTRASDSMYKQVSTDGLEFSTCNWMFLHFAAQCIFQYWCYEDFSTISEIYLSCCPGEGRQYRFCCHFTMSVSLNTYLVMKWLWA